MGKEKDKSEEKPQVNSKLEGFNVKIDRFGEIKTSFDIDKINQFLNEEVEDKKLKDRDDLDVKRGRSEEE